MTALPDRGRLGVLPLPSLLLLLARERASAKLRLVHDDRELTLYFDHGRLLRVAPDPREPGVCSWLVGAGRLDTKAASRVLALARSRSISEEKAVLALRLIPPKDLVAALRERSAALVLEAFDWTEAGFEIEVSIDEDARLASSAALADEVRTLVHRGLTGRWSTERIVALLGPAASRFVRPRPDLDQIVADWPRIPGLDALRRCLDSKTRLVDAARDADHPGALAAAVLLESAGALELRDEPDAEAVLAEHANASPEIEIVVEARGADASPESREEAASEKRAAARSDLESLRRTIRSLHERVAGLDHYEVLGVSRGSDLQAIRRAYVAAAKRFHPDVILRLGADDLREEANVVFAAVSRAHAVLSDPAARREYDEGLCGGGVAEAQRIATAETLFRKGEVLLRKGSFDEALQFLRPAVEICGDDPVYLEAFGWALFKKQIPEPDAALAALERAIGIDPANAVSRTRLATVLRALGKESEAREHLEKARALGSETRRT